MGSWKENLGGLVFLGLHLLLGSHVILHHLKLSKGESLPILCQVLFQERGGRRE